MANGGGGFIFYHFIAQLRISDSEMQIAQGKWETNLRLRFIFKLHFSSYTWPSPFPSLLGK